MLETSKNYSPGVGRSILVMANLMIENDILRIELSVSERFLTIHGRDIEIPLADIVEVSVVDDVMGALEGLRMPGTGIPGILALGTWRGHDGDSVFHDFALIHRAGSGVVVAAQNAVYRRVLLSTDDPDGMAASVQR